MKLHSDDLINEINKLMDEANDLIIEMEVLKRAQDNYGRCMRAVAESALH